MDNHTYGCGSITDRWPGSPKLPHPVGSPHLGISRSAVTSGRVRTDLSVKSSVTYPCEASLRFTPYHPRQTCLLVISSSVTWASSASMCDGYDGELVKIEDAMENEFVRRLLPMCSVLLFAPEARNKPNNYRRRQAKGKITALVPVPFE